MLKIQVILGSTRPQRMSEAVGKWIAGAAKKKDGVAVELLDLRDYPMPFYDEAATPKTVAGNFANEAARRWVKKIGEGDGYIIVAPEYNHGYTAVLKNALDYPYAEWNNKAVGFVAYGSVGGARAVEQLRQVSVELQMAPIRNALHIMGVWTAFDEKGQPKDPALVKAADDFLNQLIWWTGALKVAREKK